MPPSEDIFAIVVLVSVGALLLGAFAWQISSGIFREGVFADAPLRSGTLTVLDLLFGLLLALGGQIVGSGLALVVWRAKMPVGAGEPGTAEVPLFLLWVTGMAELFVLPGLMLMCLRIRQATEGGLKRFGFSMDDFGERLRVAIRVIIFVVPAAFVVLMLSGWLWQSLGGQTPKVGHDLLKAIRDAQNPAIKSGLILLAVVVAPVIEEFFYRGLVQTALRNSGLVRGRWKVIVLASALFAVIHILTVPVPGMPGLFVLALGLGYVYERTGAIWASMLLHAAFNAANVIAVLSGVAGG